MRDYFHNYWYAKEGFTEQEALELIAKVNDMYRVGKYNSKWKPAILVPDNNKKSGFMVMIEKSE